MHVKVTNTIRLFSPAKVNLLLAVTGKRDDGFHDLISLVAPVSFGDELQISKVKNSASIEFECLDSAVPSDGENLVVQAAKAFFQASKVRPGGIRIQLEKRIPMEAGLGGGSSNAATTLLALNALFDRPLEFGKLCDLAAGLGSDCPLFLYRAPVVMRGRGEQVEELDDSLLNGLRGRTVAIFKPGLGISTAWAYQALSREAGNFADSARVEDQLQSWKSGGLSLDRLLFNSFEPPVFKKFVVFPALFERIRDALKLHPLMSGSGSSCLVVLPNQEAGKMLQSIVKEAFGEGSFFEICTIDTFK